MFISLWLYFTFTLAYSLIYYLLTYIVKKPFQVSISYLPRLHSFFLSLITTSFLFSPFHYRFRQIASLRLSSHFFSLSFALLSHVLACAIRFPVGPCHKLLVLVVAVVVACPALSLEINTPSSSCFLLRSQVLPQPSCVRAFVRSFLRSCAAPTKVVFKQWESEQEWESKRGRVCVRKREWGWAKYVFV